MSKRRSIPRMGLFCYKCSREDFGNNPQRLSSHVQHCNGPKINDQTRSKKKKKSSVDTFSFSQSHPKGTSQFPFSVNRRRLKDHHPTICFEVGNPDNYLPEAEYPDDDCALEVNPLLPSNTSFNDCHDPPFHDPPPANSSLQPTHEPTKPFHLQAALPSSFIFQLQLSSICNRHRTDLKLQDELIALIQQHSTNQTLAFSSDNLQNRSAFVKSLGKNFQTDTLKHKDVIVPGAKDGSNSVAVFSLEAMILSLLLDDSIMHPDNIAEGYDLLTGKSTGPTDHYGEIHTGDAWDPAVCHYCGDDPRNMPIALVIFADESHFDAKGTLKTLPIMFTLTCFNLKARNNVRFWRPLAYIPNLGYGALSSSDTKNIDTKTPATFNCQTEHNCIKAALAPLVEISKQGGIRVMVRGQQVTGKVWIHFIVGDTSGNNRWLGHFNSGSNVERPYRDCKCKMDDMGNSNPQCQYITIAEYHQHKRTRNSLQSQTEKMDLDKKLSKHPIENASMDSNVPLSDLVHGVYCMTPPERLHTTCEGSTKYIFEALVETLKTCEGSKELMDMMERLHFTIHHEWKRNSERDFPRSAARNGLLNHSKVTGSERRGNLLRLLCLSHTDLIHNTLKDYLRSSSISIHKFFECLKLYLSMEEWFHQSNPKDEVNAARTLIAYTIELMQFVFPRQDGRGWNIPKSHGLTKFQKYIKLFGSASNFFGGVGESNHKKFVKDTGNNTQKRAHNFTSQIATRYYERMVHDIAEEALSQRNNLEYDVVQCDIISYPIMEGIYKLTLDINGTDFSIRKSANNKLSVKFVEAMVRFISKYEGPSTITITGYTVCKLDLDGRPEIFRAVSNYGDDGEWYDWCLIEWEDHEETYPGHILGFFEYYAPGIHSTNYRGTLVFAVVQSSESTSPMSMNRMSKDFISKFQMPEDLDEFTYCIPIDSIVNPLCVFKNFGGQNREYFCALPQRKWGRYFGDRIDI